jgi:hypothetical protein
MRERGQAKSGWEQERKEFLEERGMRLVEREGKRVEEVGWFEELMKKDKEGQRKERWEKIREARYNRWYKEIKEEGVPDYLKIGWGERVDGGE